MIGGGEVLSKCGSKSGISGTWSSLVLGGKWDYHYIASVSLSA